jgi:hypothetical protein
MYPVIYGYLSFILYPMKGIGLQKGFFYECLRGRPGPHAFN